MANGWEMMEKAAPLCLAGALESRYRGERAQQGTWEEKAGLEKESRNGSEATDCVTSFLTWRAHCPEEDTKRLWKPHFYLYSQVTTFPRDIDTKISNKTNSRVIVNLA